MTEFWNLIFSQYQYYTTFDIVLEAAATLFGLVSVVFSMRENILVFPTGLVNTSIYVYILYYAGLFGDMWINIYYVVMGIYGWYIWTRKLDDTHYLPIRNSTRKEKLISAILLVVTFIVVSYILANHTTSTVPYIDAFTTSIFFVAMWLMAKKTIDNWVFWIIGNAITVPLYIYKGLTITSFQYLVFTALAVAGYIKWKKNLNKPRELLLR
ncbi:MAG: nicotinamide mononucleotide transporter [Ichthyobacteriaceae bacterium]|nr:nicotinamide mononucleotide transporter [Ichthyobacteriaceae bacterium]